MEDTGEDLPRAIPHYISSNEVEFVIEPTSLIGGCTDANAVNFDIVAQEDDGSCQYEIDCRNKYVIATNELATTHLVSVDSGYNVLNYPYLFSGNQINFFEALNSSYRSFDDLSFSENDFAISFFEDKTYTAVFMDGKWTSVSDDGLDMNYLSPGQGFILSLNKPGTIVWSLN